MPLQNMEPINRLELANKSRGWVVKKGEIKSPNDGRISLIFTKDLVVVDNGGTIRSMTKVIVYIAASLDGYIARKNDDVSWLDAFQVEGEDYGYADFIKTIGTAVMGARTYDQSLKHPERLLAGLKTYVLSAKSMAIPAGADVEFYHGDLGAFVEKIRGESTGDVFVVGGGQVVSSFLNDGLVDEILHFVVPVLLGDGIPLYPALHQEIGLKLVAAVPYRTGIVKLHYLPQGRPRGLSC